MKVSSNLTMAIVAGVFIIGTTYLHGRMTDRWGGRDVAAELKVAAELLESRFPRQCGDWHADEELESSPKELERAGAVGHVARSYRNAKSGAKVSVFVVCATPHNASGHTPDRCYPGAGFEIGETEHRQSVPLAEGQAAEAFSGTFRKSGQTLRVFWTYGVAGRWVAPQIARIELANAEAVYKLYAIIDETALPAGMGGRVCAEFLAVLLADFDAALAEKPPVEIAT
ncbi:MAG: exosortase-associated EpsI family protein [Planctomycetes bacterium]|nr:exosortase-associated EpsI family protein [Planctomycetota bacterium]